jgi:TPR repeat protein
MASTPVAPASSAPPAEDACLMRPPVALPELEGATVDACLAEGERLRKTVPQPNGWRPRAAYLYTLSCKSGTALGCHWAAILAETGGKTQDAASGYATACDRGSMMSCHSLGELARRCTYVLAADQSFNWVDYAIRYLSRACEGGNVESCVYQTLLERDPKPDRSDVPPWLPSAEECAATQAALSKLVAPNE